MRPDGGGEAGALRFQPFRTPNTIVDATYEKGRLNSYISHTALKRIGEPDDIARAVAFLVADAPFVTGQILAVDGGRSLSA